MRRSNTNVQEEAEEKEATLIHHAKKGKKIVKVLI